MSSIQPSRAPVDRICRYCEHPFTATLNAVKRGKGNYCSPACGRHAPKPSREQSGPNNPNWKGGISQDHYHYKQLQVERHPELVRAHALVHRAKDAGDLIPQPCEVCKSTDDIHAHHADYTRPLDVTWLCPTHHRMAHGKSC